MAKKVKYLELNTEEYETVYRVYITTIPEGGMSQQRVLCDMLDQMESMGDPKTDDESNVPMYTTRGGKDVVVVLLTKNEESTFRNTLTAGVKRFQSWATRAVPGILDRLESLEPVNIGGTDDDSNEATGDEGEAQPDEE